VRRKLKQFPEVVQARIDTKTQKAYLEALPSFDQYVALEHAIEDAGGAISMFHPSYVVPKAVHATLGVKGRTLDKIDQLETRLKGVPGVRQAIVDEDRWFTNEQGIDVGGAVVFADPNPKLQMNLVQAGKAAGFILEPSDHDPNSDKQAWSEMNHAFAGLCLMALAIIGFLQLSLSRPPWFVSYGTAFIWLALFVFLFIRSDRGSWPLGPISWWDSFRQWETAQHRIGIGLILLIAVGDFMRIRKGWTVNPAMSRWGTLIIGGIGCWLLFSHLHSTLDPAHEKAVRRMNLQHQAMATSVLFFTLSKFAWEAWKVPRKWGQYLWLIFLGILGLLLNLYAE